MRSACYPANAAPVNLASKRTKVWGKYASIKNYIIWDGNRGGNVNIDSVAVRKCQFRRDHSTFNYLSYCE